MVVLGTRGPFTCAALAAILRAGGRPRGLVVAGAPGAGARVVPPPSRIVLHASRDAVALAGEHGIPVVEVGDPALPWPGVLARPDVIVAACWPWRVPRAWRERARLALNVHPSLLPAWRGPAPLFWQMRAGVARTGVSVHLMADALDAGPVVAREEAAVRTGDTYRELEERLAAAGGALAARVAARGAVPAELQDERAATTQGWPADADRRLEARWPLDRAWTFLGALDPWGPFVVETAGGPAVVHARLSRAEGEVLGVPRRDGPEGTVALQFAGGVIRAR